MQNNVGTSFLIGKVFCPSLVFLMIKSGLKTNSHVPFRQILGRQWKGSEYKWPEVSTRNRIFFPKINNLSKNRNVNQKPKFLPKIDFSPKINNLSKNRNVNQKPKFLPKIDFFPKINNLSKNRNVNQKQKFLPKIETLTTKLYFNCILVFCRFLIIAAPYVCIRKKVRTS